MIPQGQRDQRGAASIAAISSGIASRLVLLLVDKNSSVALFYDLMQNGRNTSGRATTPSRSRDTFSVK